MRNLFIDKTIGILYMDESFAPTEVTLDINSMNVTEDSGEALEYIFTRDGDTNNPLTVNFTVDGSAIFDTDYEVEGAVIDGTTGEVIIAEGESEATVSITPIVDSDIESDETVKLSLAEGDYIFEDSQDEDVMLMGSITNDDPKLNVDWVNQFSGDDYSTDYLAVDEEGNTYVTGSFEGTLTLGDDTLTAEDSLDVFVAKINEDGDVLWAESFGGDDFDRVEDIAVDDDGNTYFTGTFYGTATFGTENLESDQGGEFGDVFVAKLNSDGDVVWAEDFGNTNDDEYASAIDLDSEGNVYITGEFEEEVTFGSTT
ncbi:MAG: Calx-beta domain-containing protein, partial [Cyanobacteria bacterium P01_D01_bin.50]